MLPGFFISNFRNFGDDEQYVGPLSKINLFIGANNSGKSNILRFLRDVLSPLCSSRYGVSAGDAPAISTPRFDVKPKRERWLVLRYDDETIRDYFSFRRPSRDNWKLFFDNHPLKQSDGLIRVPVAMDAQGRITVVNDLLSFSGVDHAQASDIWSSLTGQSGGGFSTWHREIFNELIKRQISQLDPVYIPSFRQIDTRLSEFTSEYKSASDGEHLIDRLAELAYPPYDKQDLKDRFERLRRFIGEVINRPNVEIEIPHDRKTINVKTDRSVVPIEALGSGIHELFMLASLIVLNSNKTILLEEPEVHMHPDLQRKLMAFITRESDSQFFITTHSAHIIDTSAAAVFGVRSADGVASVEPLLTGNAKRRMCSELGYRPSDLLQSNCVIWVEGPSDRIYLKHWIGHVAAYLKEGIHYSIMFYGGRLLSHVSAEDTEVDDFVGLLPINRYPVILMDSDRGSDDQEIGSTKTRILSQLEASGGLGWVTFGREIENYVPASLRFEAVQHAHPSASALAGGSNRFAKPLDYLSGTGNRVTGSFDKVKIARYVASHAPDLSLWDLRERVAELVDFICAANRIDLPQRPKVSSSEIKVRIVNA